MSPMNETTVVDSVQAPLKLESTYQGVKSKLSVHELHRPYVFSKSMSTCLQSSSAFRQLQQKFAEDMALPRKIRFDAPDTEDDCQPPLKRRRFQRRNSKTAAMLYSSMSAIVSSDLESTFESKPERDSDLDEDGLCGGLEIAEELVRQLQLRKSLPRVSST